MVSAVLLSARDGESFLHCNCYQGKHDLDGNDQRESLGLLGKSILGAHKREDKNNAGHDNCPRLQ